MRGIYRLIRSAIERPQNEAFEATYRAKRKPYQSARAKQLEDLIQSIPTTPPEHIRATIVINTYQMLIPLSERSEDGQDEVPADVHAVDMVLQLSEKDRATILACRIDDTVIDRVPQYSNAEVLTILDGWYFYSAYELGDPLGKVPQPEGNFEQLSSKTKDITVGDYMKVPYTVNFSRLGDAQDYVEKLKTKTLPGLRQHIERNTDRDTSHTVEL